VPKLSIDILRNRLGEEIQMCMDRLVHDIEVCDPKLLDFPVKVKVTFKNVPAPVLINDTLGEQLIHKLIILVSEQYPYEKPKVQWQTPIFHPNIMMPEDGGLICTKLLDNWSFHSNLLSFIIGIETLMVNPNPESPWDTNSCTLSAEYFNKNQYTPPAILTKIENQIKIVINE
jgi:ubiquitin-protein ligase